MNAEYLVIDDGSDWQAVEDITKDAPNVGVVELNAFLIKPKLTIDIRAFVVTTEKEEVFWVHDLKCEEEADVLDALASTVHVVAEEQVVCVWRELASLK